MKKEFKLKEGEEYVELKNLLKIMNYVNSGGVAKIIILNGEVEVNGEVELRRGKKLRNGDKVSISEDEITIIQ